MGGRGGGTTACGPGRIAVGVPSIPWPPGYMVLPPRGLSEQGRDSGEGSRGGEWEMEGRERWTEVANEHKINRKKAVILSIECFQGKSSQAVPPSSYRFFFLFFFLQFKCRFG